MFGLSTSVVLLTLGAAIGVGMAVVHGRGGVSGSLVGVLHGVFVVLGLAALVYGLVDVGAGAGWWILASFLVAATGGAYLFSRQRKGEPWPGLVIAAHGGLALVTLVGLGLWVFTGVGGSVQAADVERSDVPQGVEPIETPAPELLPERDALDDGPPADGPAEGVDALGGEAR